MGDRVIKIIAVLFVVGACVAAVCFFTLRATSTEVDASIASIRESHTCPWCGKTFVLTVAEAAAMRREKGDIFCPACGKAGALKQASTNSGELVNTYPPPGTAEQEEPAETEESANRPHKPVAPTASMTRKPPPPQ